MTSVRLAAIAIAGPSAPWEALGFAIDADGRLPLANGAIEFDADAPAFVIDLAAETAPPGSIEGIPVVSGSISEPVDHPNGAWELDHVVVMTDSLDRMSAAIGQGLGLEQRRLRETATVRQAFHRFADQGASRGCIIEIVENPRVERPTLWGLVINVTDLDRLCADAAEHLGAPKPAVQPGRRIATVRREVGLGTAVAFMSAE